MTDQKSELLKHAGLLEVGQLSNGQAYFYDVLDSARKIDSRVGSLADQSEVLESFKNLLKILKQIEIVVSLPTSKEYHVDGQVSYCISLIGSRLSKIIIETVDDEKHAFWCSVNVVWALATSQKYSGDFFDFANDIRNELTHIKSVHPRVRQFLAEYDGAR